MSKNCILIFLLLRLLFVQGEANLLSAVSGESVGTMVSDVGKIIAAGAMGIVNTTKNIIHEKEQSEKTPSSPHPSPSPVPMDSKATEQTPIPKNNGTNGNLIPSSVIGSSESDLTETNSKTPLASNGTSNKNTTPTAIDKARKFFGIFSIPSDNQEPPTNANKPDSSSTNPNSSNATNNVKEGGGGIFNKFFSKLKHMIGSSKENRNDDAPRLLESSLQKDP